MRNNETGEFELVLGNRQLISGFFIVVILFGIFFAMGYIVGRYSAPSPRVQADASGPNLPAVTDTRPQAASPGVVTQPAAIAGGAGDAKPADASGHQLPPDLGTQTPPQAAGTAAAAEPPAAAAAQPADPAPSGTYLQVMAVRQPEAEVVLRSLKDKGFPASLGPGPNGLIRVLVGPYPDTAALGKAKAELENAGFHPIVKK